MYVGTVGSLVSIAVRNVAMKLKNLKCISQEEHFNV